jgi:hypothetical protein
VATYQKRRVCVLVKAYPQRSQKYEETVCVAAVTDDHRLLRLYPVRFRHLDESKRFVRFDWLELEVTRPSDDVRPESFRMKEDSLRIIKRKDDTKPEERAQLWKPCVSKSLEALHEEQRDHGKSLGIIRPDPESVKFRYSAIDKANPEERDEIQQVYQEQQSLLEEPLTKLPAAEYIFRYQFTSGGNQHSMQIHDWEVQATYEQYKKRYGSSEKALEKMVDYYERRAPKMNLHLVMGTLHGRPYQFIIIGVLRTTADLDQVDAQSDLFSRG